MPPHRPHALRLTATNRATPPWRCAVAAWVAAAVLAIGIGAASPEVHDHVHDDAHDTGHACAITLAALGFCDTAALAPAIEPGPASPAVSFPEPGSFSWVTPAWWLVPAHAPPTFAA